MAPPSSLPRYRGLKAMLSSASANLPQANGGSTRSSPEGATRTSFRGPRRAQATDPRQADGVFDGLPDIE